MTAIRRALTAAPLALLFVATSAPADPPKGERYALLVGVREYDKSELRPLKYTEDDVTALAAVLKEAGYARVVLMTQAEGANKLRFLPTAENIRVELKGLLEDRRPEDTLVVAFAGHGVQFAGKDEHFFCPADARLSDRNGLISLTEVYKGMKACKAGAKLLLVDACRNDPASDLARDAGVKLASVTRPQEERPPGGVAALFSCSAGAKRRSRATS
jgi:uncharacterized caspase-like protein